MDIERQFGREQQDGNGGDNFSSSGQLRRNVIDLAVRRQSEENRQSRRRQRRSERQDHKRVEARSGSAEGNAETRYRTSLKIISVTLCKFDSRVLQSAIFKELIFTRN
jgi:hypothetical protein